MIRRIILAAALCGATAAGALPPANNEVTLQPTDIRDWSCNFQVPVTTLIDHEVIVRAGSDSSPATLISEPTISGTKALFRITPAGKTSGTIYQVTIVAADASGQQFTCDGKVTVRTMRVVI